MLGVAARVLLERGVEIGCFFLENHEKKPALAADCDGAAATGCVRTLDTFAVAGGAPDMVVATLLTFPRRKLPPELARDGGGGEIISSIAAIGLRGERRRWEARQGSGVPLQCECATGS